MPSHLTFGQAVLKFVRTQMLSPDTGTALVDYLSHESRLYVGFLLIPRVPAGDMNDASRPGALLSPLAPWWPPIGPTHLIPRFLAIPRFPTPTAPRLCDCSGWVFWSRF